jgi:DNA-binding transcriptional LysR family regulator
MALVCAPDYDLAGRRVIRKEDLGRHPFVSLARRSTSDDRLQELGVEHPNIVMRLGNVEGLKQAVRGGLGLAVMFRCSVASELAAGVLTELHVDGV